MSRSRFFFFKFKQLVRFLKLKFLKVNNQVICSPFFQVFLYDCIELSYLKLFEQFSIYTYKLSSA